MFPSLPRIVVTLAALGLAWAQPLAAQEGGTMMAKEPTGSGSSMKGDGGPTPEGAMMRADPGAGVFSTEGLGPQLVTFTSEADARALAAGRTVVLVFVSAPAAETQALVRQLKARRADLPARVTFVLVDLAKNPGAAARFQAQALTLVRLGATRAADQSWQGTTSVPALLDRLGKF